MSAIRFLCDEHLRGTFPDALRHREPAMEVFQVGGLDAPPLHTLDPDLLRFAEENKLALITMDRRTIPGHVAQHLAAGRHTWGVFLVRRKAAWRQLIDDLVLIWSASQAEEWIDRIERLPW